MSTPSTWQHLRVVPADAGGSEGSSESSDGAADPFFARLGNEGWELVAAAGQPVALYFKRPATAAGTAAIPDVPDGISVSCWFDGGPIDHEDVPDA